MQAKLDYMKQRSRIQRIIRNAEKRGYTVDKSILPEIPKKPNIKSVEKLKKIKPADIYAKSTYQTQEGKTVSGTEGRSIERRQAARRAAYTRHFGKQHTGVKIPQIGRQGNKGNKIPSIVDVVLKQIEDMISQWTPISNWTPFFTDVKRKDRNILDSILKGAIAKDGRAAVAKRCEDNATELISLTQEILYGSGGGDAKEGGAGRAHINFQITRFSAIIMGRPLTVDESEELTDATESLEVNN